MSDGWWGSSYFLLKGEPPHLDADVKVLPEPSALTQTVTTALAGLPGEPAEFGRPEWSRSGICERAVSEMPGHTVDAEFVLYAEAQVGVTEWRVCVYNGRASDSRLMQVLVGLRGDEPVAVIAPRRSNS